MESRCFAARSLGGKAEAGHGATRAPQSGDAPTRVGWRDAAVEGLAGPRVVGGAAIGGHLHGLRAGARSVQGAWKRRCWRWQQRHSCHALPSGLLCPCPNAHAHAQLYARAAHAMLPRALPLPAALPRRSRQASLFGPAAPGPLTCSIWRPGQAAWAVGSRQKRADRRQRAPTTAAERGMVWAEGLPGRSGG